MMPTCASIARTSLPLMVGLLVLTVTLSDTPLALVQAEEACPLPAGVTPPVPPTVTAQQVENGSRSVMEFVLAVRDQYRRGTASPAEAFHLGCLIRLEGSPWRSGDTYVVTLTTDGRVYGHAKDMSFSGRLLKPEIYGAILRALGINPADLANREAAVAALVVAAAGNGGAFDVPNVPDASGYAALITPEFVVLAGADLDEIYFAEEEIDFGDPAVTAAQVVDRATLKAFVTQAGEYIADIVNSGRFTDIPKSKIAFRDPSGPWRHGSVYLYALDLTSNIIMFHGAFPDRYESRPLVPLARDAVTGELVLPQILEAAESSPEGGFVVYHFDDPTDDSDSAQIPKVGYARHFSVRVGAASTLDFVVGSGFYLDSDGEFVRRLLEGVDDGQNSMMFAITTPVPGDAVAGNAVAVSVTGAPTDAVHFAYRPTGARENALTYLGAANNRAALAWFAWDTLDLADGDYELVAMYTEDEGDSVIYDAIPVRVENAAPADMLDIVEDRGRKTQPLLADAPQQVVTSYGAVVRLPAGALAGDDRITIEATDPPDPATAPGDVVGSGIDVTLAGGHDVFLERVSISLPYAEGVLDETDIAEGGLSMWHFDAETDAWALVPGSTVMREANRVVAHTAQVGEFSLFNAAPLLRLEQDGEPVLDLDFGASTEMLSIAVVNGNDTGERLTWAVATPQPSWLSTSESGETVTVTVDRAGLQPGDYTGTVSVTSNGGDWPLPVSMRVPGGGGGGCAAVPVLPGGPLDPTLTALVGLLLTYLIFARRRAVTPWPAA